VTKRFVQFQDMTVGGNLILYQETEYSKSFIFMSVVYGNYTVYVILKLGIFRIINLYLCRRKICDIFQVELHCCKLITETKAQEERHCLNRIWEGFNGL